MIPNSLPANDKHLHRSQKSIIRTRSQQQRLFPSIDMSVSPLKEAIRNHNHTKENPMKNTTANQPYLQTENTKPGEPGPLTDKLDDEMVAFAKGKRPSSPSFLDSKSSEKRGRVLCQSNKINSPSRQHSEESFTTPQNDTTPRKSLVQKQVLPHSSPSKVLVHMDLVKLPPSPLKLSKSPAKTFSVTDNDGNTIRVPVTPNRRAVIKSTTDIPDVRKPDTTPTRCGSHVGSPMRMGGLPNLSALHSIPHKEPLTSTTTQEALLGEPASKNENEVQIIIDNNGTDPSRPGPNFSPIRSGLIGNKILFGPPLTPLPPKYSSTPSRESNTPFSLLEQPRVKLAIAPGSNLSTSSDAIPKLAEMSPTKSRIPLPSGSRFARPPSLAFSTLVTAGPSSPHKFQTRQSPVRSKARPKNKVYLGNRPKAPMTRLAAKRGIQRNVNPGAKALSTAKFDGRSPSPAAAGPSYAVATASARGKRKSIFSHPVALNNKTVPGVIASSLGAGSPKKSTPLTALSSALQKLQTPAPSAPSLRPRPNSSLGFALTPSQAKHETTLNNQDNTNLTIKTSGRSWLNPADMPRSYTPPENSRSAEAQKESGKIGLPMWRPTSVDSRRSGGGTGGVLFASKMTTLSTVPASPSKSAISPSTGTLTTFQQTGLDVVDVDNDIKGKGKIISVQNETKANDIEYLVPLSDGHQMKREAQLEFVSPSRRASQASLALTQSLSLPHTASTFPQARSVSTSSATHFNPRSPVKTRNRTMPPALAEGSGNPMGGKRSNARMPGSLNVLRDCIIFVDVRTEEGEDAAALFVDMLRGLGARILAKPGKSCTHLVYKAGLPSTVTKYKLLPEPRPLVVSIGWVVECVEKRTHVDETKFLVNLDEFGVAGGAQRRRSMQPRTLSLNQLDNGESVDISIRAQPSFTSEEPSMPSGLILDNLSPSTRSPRDNLPPLERARQRSMRLPRE